MERERSRCLLCDEAAQPSAYLRLHVVERPEHRAAKRYELDARVCQKHANQLVKHLKRMIPRRLFRIEAAT